MKAALSRASGYIAASDGLDAQVNQCKCGASLDDGRYLCDTCRGAEDEAHNARTAQWLLNESGLMLLPGTTRIDMVVLSGGVLVNQFDPGYSPSMAAMQKQITSEQADKLIEALTLTGWTLRAYMPVGARLWKGKPRPVRTAWQSKRKRAELSAHPVPGLQSHALDLAYDL